MNKNDLVSAVATRPDQSDAGRAVDAVFDSIALHSSLVVMFVLLVLVRFLLRNAPQQPVATQELVKQSRSRHQSNQNLRLVRH